MNNIRRSLLLLILFTLFLSCDILRDSRFEVAGWSPGTGFYDDLQKISISVTFSHEPDRSSVEKYFSLAAESEFLKGNFSWKGATLYFLPFVPFESNKDYSIKISANAMDTKGLSMDKEFEGGFTTRSDTVRPKIISVLPAMDGIMDRSQGLFTIEFSSPVSLNSLRNNAYFNPSTQGVWNLEKNGTIAVFTPFGFWVQGKRYEFRLSAAVTGSNGIGVGKDLISVFTVGIEREPPYLLRALKVSSSEETYELFYDAPEVFNDNAGWEKTDKLKLIFSKDVDLLSVNSAVSAENGTALTLELPLQTGSVQEIFLNEALFSFEKFPAYESRFFIKIKSGIKDLYGNESVSEFAFRIFANGENSKPPSLVGIRIPMSPGGTSEDFNDFQLLTFGIDSLFSDLPIKSEYYPYNAKTFSWIEFYFDCAPGVTVDLFSLMEKFRVETSNNVISFSPIVVRNEYFYASDPCREWEQYARVEISGMLTNTVNAGIVHFIVNQGLSDSSGNLSEKQLRISLLN